MRPGQARQGGRRPRVRSGNAAGGQALAHSHQEAHGTLLTWALKVRLSAQPRNASQNPLTWCPGRPVRCGSPCGPSSGTGLCKHTCEEVGEVTCYRRPSEPDGKPRGASVLGRMPAAHSPKSATLATTPRPSAPPVCSITLRALLRAQERAVAGGAEADSDGGASHMHGMHAAMNVSMRCAYPGTQQHSPTP